MPRPDRHCFQAVAGSPYCGHPGCGLVPQNGIHLDVPVLPYAGTSGWSGSATSRDRAVTADRSGDTTERQRAVLAYLDAAQAHGATWKEVDDALAWHHHGKTTGVLSVLHKTGLIDRLAERRDRCEVYVLPEHVNGRETRQQGRVTPTWTDQELRAIESLERAVETAQPASATDVRTLLDGVRRLM